MATIRTGAAALLALMLAGCVSPTPRFDKHFGESVRTNLAAQVANPAAAANPDPVQGVDGRAARGAQERYEKSFTQPEGPPSSLVGAAGK
jgi:outer membrane murein-binding lipoprotein Lpp